jgi:hypothetical protein
MNQVVFSGKKKDKKSISSNWIDQLIGIYQKKQALSKKDLGPKLRVNQTLSSLASVYEKIRNAVDFRGEHLFRRNAIERILRRLWMGNGESQKISESLIKELIWSRYLKNDSIPKKKITKTAQIIAKYQKTKKHLPPKDHDWILKLASAEIDETIVNQSEKEVWARTVCSWFEKYYQWEEQIDQQTKDILLYIAIHRSIIKSDDAFINFHLLCKLHPEWKAKNEEAKEEIIANFATVKKEIETWTSHPYSNSLFRFVNKNIPPFIILKDIIEETEPNNLENLLKNQEVLDKKIATICARKYQETRAKVKRGIVRSIIYIFATKMILAFMLEIPVDWWYMKREFGQDIKLFSKRFFTNFKIIPLAINLTLPPLLMFLIGFMIHTPGEENTSIIIERIRSFTTPTKTDKIGFSLAKNDKKSIWEKAFGIVYIALFVGIFYLVSTSLSKLGFNLISIGIFFFFVCLVFLFGFRVRWAAQELMVANKKESFLETIVNFLSLPFLDVGIKLSAGIAKFNFLIFILDFLIEAPLKSIIDAIGEWASMIRKKQEEVVEVPFQ